MEGYLILFSLFCVALLAGLIAHMIEQNWKTPSSKEVTPPPAHPVWPEGFVDRSSRVTSAPPERHHSEEADSTNRDLLQTAKEIEHRYRDESTVSKKTAQGLPNEQTTQPVERTDSKYDHWRGSEGSRYPPDWEARKIEVKQRDGNRCVVSGCLSREVLHVHHIIPISRGGDHVIGNLATVCELHHLLMPDHLEPLRDRVRSARYSVVGAYTARNPGGIGYHSVRTSFRRHTFFNTQDVQDVFRKFELVCSSCDHGELEFQILRKEKKLLNEKGSAREYALQVTCIDCGETRYYVRCLVEELGLLLAHHYQSNCKSSKLRDQESIWLAEIPAASVCPPCPRHDCDGHSVWRQNPRDGRFFQGCSNYPDCRGTPRSKF